ncbi:MAG: glycosyltransferase [Planctomyces sp.]|nr:glycosyltransferase [Planctomyces sp.]
MYWFGWCLFGFVALWTIPPTIASVFKQLRPLRLREPAGPGAAQDSLRPDTRSLSLVTVIVPAKNEEAQIRTALETILRSTHVRLELIAVNDRSSDQTGAIMDDVARGDDRLRVIHISELPEGWLGKNHAMHVAAQQAKGEWILFTDGDVIYEPLAIASAVDYSERLKLQHLTLLPRMLPGRMIENATVAFFGLSFTIGMHLHLIRTAWPFSYAGVGAFNLIRADFYRSFGGHTPIAMDVLDDVKLGKLVKRNGGVQDFLSASDLLSIRWQPSFWGVITGLEKNGFAALSYSIRQLLLMTAVFVVMMIGPYFMAAALPRESASGFIATVLLWHSVYGIASVLSGGGWRLIPWFPIGAISLAFAFWRSAVITLRQGGVRWRDSFYPLAQLRSRMYR